MTAADLFRNGRLRDAIDAQIAEVKSSPGDPNKRLFLFDLCLFAGDYDRALKQIEAIRYPEPDRMTALMGYRKLLDAEEHRTRVFRDGVMPQFLIPAPDWVYPRLEAVAAMKAGDQKKAAELIAKSDADAVFPAASIDGKQADALRDCDDLFGPMLEVLANGGYYWLPLSQVESIAANPPKTPRDLIWFPVKLSVKEGPAGDAYIPTRYPGTTASAEESLKLARATDWSAEPPIRGLGLRLFLVGDDAVPITDWREMIVSS